MHVTRSLGITLTGLLCLFLSWSCTADPLRVATVGSYPPFSYFDSNGRLTGFDADIARALCVEMKRQCDLQAMPWKDLIGQLEKGNIDMVVASMADTPEREKHVDFTHYYYRSHTIFTGRKGVVSQTTPEALKGLRLATSQNTIQAAYLQKHYTQSKIILTGSQDEGLKLLTAGKVDLVLSDTLNLLDFLKQPRNSAYDFVGPPLESPELKSEASIAIPKHREPLRQAINAALKRIRLSGVYDRINERYFPFSVY